MFVFFILFTGHHLLHIHPRTNFSSYVVCIDVPSLMWSHATDPYLWCAASNTITVSSCHHSHARIVQTLRCQPPWPLLFPDPCLCAVIAVTYTVPMFCGFLEKRLSLGHRATLAIPTAVMTLYTNHGSQICAGTSKRGVEWRRQRHRGGRSAVAIGWSDRTFCRYAFQNTRLCCSFSLS
jgi:hypothetical protein